MMDLKQACEFVGIPLTKRQASKWRRGEGRAYTLAKHFAPVHEKREEINAERRRTNAALERINADIEAHNKERRGDEGFEPSPLHDLTPMLPVPATSEEQASALSTLSLAGVV